MILIGLFLVVLAGAFLLQSFGVGGDSLFEVVWPILVGLIGLGFIGEARKRKQWKEAERALIEKELKANQASSPKAQQQSAPQQEEGRDAGFKKSVE